ncbi:MAG: hypothetical protein ISN28_10890 [Ectothiorhodospiraceae bacterium AqS1]|nr:hypothetical protein [Ectothiorhodospiraceae bacterium AqS1]
MTNAPVRAGCEEGARALEGSITGPIDARCAFARPSAVDAKALRVSGAGTG